MTRDAKRWPSFSSISLKILFSMQMRISILLQFHNYDYIQCTCTCTLPTHCTLYCQKQFQTLNQFMCSFYRANVSSWVSRHFFKLHLRHYILPLLETAGQADFKCWILGVTAKAYMCTLYIAMAKGSPLVMPLLEVIYPE